MAATASAQSLGDVAKEEAARRKSTAKAGKVYTNDSLKNEPPPAAPAAQDSPAQPAAAPATADKPAGDAKKADEGKKAAEPAKDETYWKKRIQAERDAVSRGETFAAALQSRINALNTDFVNRDDPAQRTQIANDRTKAVAELDRVKKEIQDHTKTIADIQEEGRKAGAPAGWLR
jgi:hypothetical protein